MSTNLAKKRKPETNSFRLSMARQALDTALQPRANVTVVHAVLYADNIRVHYLQNGFHQKHGKISLENLTTHALQAFSGKNVSDITVYYFIEENLAAVCQSYLEAGKEIEAL